MIATLRHNPRILAAPGGSALAAEVARLIPNSPTVGNWFIKLDGLDDQLAVRLGRAAGQRRGGLLAAEAQEGIVRVPDDCLETLCDAVRKADPETAAAIQETVDAWRRERFSLDCGTGTLDVGHRTLIMGIVNVTPDSFSDGGCYDDPNRAIEHGKELAAQGADILDIGGESTRPGAEAVEIDEECRRVLPVIEQLAGEVRVPISVDTAKAEVARRALDAGARMLNDVTALGGDPELARVAADSGAPLILMHMQGTPRTMQREPRYGDLMAEIVACLRASMARAAEAGVREEQIVVDPGIGFGKTLEHNLEILRRLPELRSLGRPILIGTSRKSVIGGVHHVPVDQRVFGTAATVAYGIARGAHIVRVHDVAEMKQVARMSDAMVGRDFEVE